MLISSLVLLSYLIPCLSVTFAQRSNSSLPALRTSILAHRYQFELCCHVINSVTRSCVLSTVRLGLHRPFNIVGTPFYYSLPTAITGTSMDSFLGANPDPTRQPYSSVPARNVGISGTCKRKRAGDDYDLLPISGSYSAISKRQKYAYSCHKNTVKGSREGFTRDGSIGEESSDEESSDEESSDEKSSEEESSEEESIDEESSDEESCGEESSGEEGRGSLWIRSHSYQPAPDTNSKPPTRCASVSADEAVLSKISKNGRTARKDTLKVSSRKRYFVYTPDGGLKERMKQDVHDVYKLFEFCSEDDCWLHPSPPSARGNGRPPGTIPCYFVWKDWAGKNRLKVNFGMVALISEHQLTEEQMEGYVKKSWHLSHLCGNWTCCNWRHMTVESGRMNSSRNQCFRDATQCSHDPQCMKDRKRRLLITHAISNQIRRAMESTRNAARPTAGCRYSPTTPSLYDCHICGKDVLCLGYQRICPSLTSISKSQTALEKLELVIQPSDEVLKAIEYLKQIIRDLIREKEATDAVLLQRSATQCEVDPLAYWSQKQFSSYGQMLGFLLD